MRAITLCVVFLLLTFAACQPAKPVEFDPGKIIRDRYVNNYLGITVVIPDGWNVLERKAIDSLTDIEREGQKRFGLLPWLRERRVRERFTTLACLDHPVKEMEGRTDCRIVVFAESLTDFEGQIQNATDYLGVLRKNLLGQGYEEVSTSFDLQPINGNLLYQMDAIRPMPAGPVHQRIYGKIVREFFVGVIICYADARGYDLGHEIVNRMEFVPVTGKKVEGRRIM